jgi:carbon starvation protein CstA
VDLRRLRGEEWIAGACGAGLLVALFLDWYRSGSASRSGWEAFGALDVMLAVVALMALALAVVTAAHRSQAVPLAIGSLLVLIGAVATVWLAVRAASPPGGAGRDAGLWVGLGACVGVTLAALVSIRDDRFPRAVAEAARIEVPTLPAPPPEGAREARP